MKRVIIIPLTIIIILMYLIMPNTKNSHFIEDSPTTKVVSGWQFRTGDSPVGKQGSLLWLQEDSSEWKSFSVPGKPSIKSPNGLVWVRVQLPLYGYEDSSLFFMTYDQVFDMFIDGKCIYKFGDINMQDIKKSPGSPWHIIRLDRNYSGKFLYIKMHAVDPVNTGLVRSVEIGPKSSFITNIIKDNLLRFILSSMFVFIGSIIAVISLIKREQGKIFIYFSLSCISVGTWLITQSEMKQILIYAPQVWMYIDIVAQYSIPITFSLLINKLLEDRHRVVHMTVVRIHIILLMISLLLDLFNIISIVCTLSAFYITFVLSMVITMGVILKSYRYWNIETKLFSSSFAILCSFGIFDILNWNFNPKHSNTYLTQWGIFIFLSTLLLVMVLHYIKAQDKVIIYSEELKSKEKILTESKQQLEFFSNISHELRTPLNIILSTIQLLELLKADKSIEIVGKDIRNYFKIMKQNCYRLIRLVNNLIDITKIDSGYLKPRLENHDIVAVVEDITQSVADYIKSMGISIIFDTDIEERVIACDPEKIERIMLNLLSNAVKFSKPGGSILVDVHDDNKSVMICVSDTGIGIEKDKQNDIFERFVQVDKSFTRNHEGSGIGLSLVKSLVEMLGGTITVESEYRKGSTFKITLPATLIDEDDDHIEPPEIHAIHVEKVNIEFSDIYS